MKADEIKISVSPISNTIYAGKTSVDGTKWTQKSDVTEQVLSSVATYMDGNYSEITYPAGRLVWIKEGEVDDIKKIQKKYDNLVQAIRDGNTPNESAAGLIAWLESTTSFELEVGESSG